jgi:hypothetical protein
MNTLVYPPGILIRDAILDRCKLIPPFTSVARFGLTSAKPVQSEHIPYLGVYWIGETFSEDGSNRLGEPHFWFTVKLGFSYVVQNNDDGVAEKLAAAGYWSIMKLLHDPEWKDIPGTSEFVIQGITGGNADIVPGAPARNNAPPTFELQMEMSFEHQWRFEPIVTDLFEGVHHKTVYPYPDDPNRQPIISEWVIPTT